MSKRRPVTAYAALSVGVVAIAWSAIFVRWARMPGVASAFYRVFFASLALWPLLLLFKLKPARIKRSAFGFAVLGGAFFAGDVGLYNIAVLQTSAGSATFLGNNAPLLVGLLTWAMTRKSPSRRFWTALAIAVSGASLIVTVDLRHLGSGSSGDLLAVMASICFALYLLVTERLRENVDAAMILALSTTSSALVLLAFAASFHISLVVPSLSSLAALLALALVCQLLGYFCLTYALGHLPATVSSVVLLTVAPLTALFAFITFGDRMTMLQIVGGSMVLIGVRIVSDPRETRDLSSSADRTQQFPSNEVTLPDATSANLKDHRRALPIRGVAGYTEPGD